MVLFGSVIYKSALPYLDDFLKSLKNQSFQDFHLLMIDDDIPEETVNAKIKQRFTLDGRAHLVFSNGNFEPYELRVKLLECAKEMGGNLLILGDCDDIFDNYRVQKIVDSYYRNMDYGFYYNDLLKFDGEQVFDKFPDKTLYVEDIAERNYLGLSNTAVNLQRFSSDFIESLYEGKSRVFDWYFFSRVLIHGLKGMFVPEAKTYYRLHSQNFAGICDTTKEAISKEYHVKLQHYAILSGQHPLFQSLYKEYQKLDISKVQANKSSKPFWWDNIHLKRG